MSMSFFDEVETTVANTRFLQAVEDSGPVKLSLQPYEELTQLATALQAEVTLPQLLKPKTMGRYLFKQFLKEPLREKSTKVVDRQILFAFLEAVEEFSTAKTHERAAKGKAIYDIYLKYGGSRQAAANGPPMMNLEMPEADYDEDEGPEASQALREYDDDEEGNMSNPERRRSRTATLLEQKRADGKSEPTDKKQVDVHLHLNGSSKRASTVNSSASSPSSSSGGAELASSPLSTTVSPIAEEDSPPPPPPPPPPPSSPSSPNNEYDDNNMGGAGEGDKQLEIHKTPPPPPPVPAAESADAAAVTSSTQQEARKSSAAAPVATTPRTSVATREKSATTSSSASASGEQLGAKTGDTEMAAVRADEVQTTVHAPTTATTTTTTAPPPPPATTTTTTTTTLATEQAEGREAAAKSVAGREAAKSAATPAVVVAVVAEAKQEQAVATTAATTTSTASENTASTSTSFFDMVIVPAAVTTTTTTATTTAAVTTSSSSTSSTSTSSTSSTTASEQTVKGEGPIVTITTTAGVTAIVTGEGSTPTTPVLEDDPSAKLEMKVTVEGEKPGIRSRVASVDRPIDEMSFGSLAGLVKRIDNMDAILNDLVRLLSMTPPPADTFLPITEAFARILQAEQMTEDFLASPQWKRYVQLRAYVKKRMTLDHFRVFRVLGRGAFGAVSAVQKIDSHAIFAMKEMAKRQVKHQQSEWVCVNERKVLAKMKSPFVLNLKYSFHTSENLYLIFDMCSGGDLKFHLRNEKMRCFSLERARFYAAEVLLGLEHIHSLNIVYRDLKPTNILLDEAGHCVISDLGLTVHLKKNKLIKHLAGTAGYWAPEILQKAGTYKTSDYWSFGVMLYEMILGRRPTCKCSKKDPQWCPFGQSRSMEQFALKEDGVLVLDVDYPRELPADAVDLLKKLFEPNPEKRIGAKGGAAEIKAHPFFKSVDWAKLENKEITPPFKPDNHTVNANSIGEVGETNKAKYRKVKLLDEDEKHYEDFDFINMEALEAEMVTALVKMDAPPPPMKEAPRGNANGSGCCVVS